MKKNNRKLSVISAGVLFSVLSASVVGAPNELLNEAQQYFDKGEYKSAEIQIKNALKDSPKSAEARLLLGKVYLQKADLNGAAKEFQRAASYGASPKEVYGLLGKVYLAQGKPKDLISNIVIDPSWDKEAQAVITAMHGDAYASLKEYKDAEASYKKALELDGNSIGALMGMVRLAIVNKDLVAAERDLASVFKLDDQQSDAWVLKAMLTKEQGGLFEDIKSSLDKAIEITPGHVPALNARAMLLLENKKIDEAASDVDKILSLSPGYPPAYYLKGLIHFQNQEYTEAKDIFNRLVNATQDVTMANFLLGAIHFKEESYQQAEFYLSGFSATMPDHKPAKSLLAATHIKLHQPQKAVELLESFVNPENDDVQMLALLGSAYLQTGNASKGVALLEKAAEKAPDMAAIRAQLALGHLVEGDSKGAVAELKGAIDLDESVVQVDLLLINTYVRDKKYDETIAAARALVKKQPDQAIAYNALGLSLAGNGDFDAAETNFKKAVQLDPKFLNAYIGLAKIAMQRKDLDGAIKHYQTVLKQQSDFLPAMLGLSAVYQLKQDRVTSVQWVEKAHDAHPDRAEVSAMLVDMHLKAGEKLKAAQVARATLNAAPESPLAYELMGRVNMASEDFSSAKATFQKLYDLTNGHVNAAVLLAESQWRLGNIEEAAKTTQEAVKKSPDNIKALVLSAKLKIAQNKLGEALKEAQQIQKKFDKGSVGFALQGDIYMQQKKYASAQDAFRSAYDIQKNSMLALKRHAAYMAEGKKRDAENVLLDWLNVNPRDASVRMVLAVDYQRANDVENSSKHYKELLKHQPNNIPALNNLAWMLTEQENMDAVEYAKKAYDLSNQSPAVMDTYGWALIKTGKSVNDGINILKETLLKSPDLTEVRYHLAYGYYKSGDKEAARKELKWLKQLGNADAEQVAELEKLLK